MTRAAHRRRRGQLIELRIDAVGLDGLGRGRSRNEEVRVSGALPGDRVRARVEHRSPHRPELFCALEELLEPSPARRSSPCPHDGDCDGCALIGLSRPGQLAAKQAMLERTLSASFPTDLMPSRVMDIAPELGYRRRAKYVVRRVRGQLRLGAYARRSHRVVPIEGCPVVTPAIREALPYVTRALDEAAVQIDEPGSPGLRYLQLRSNARGELLVTLVARATDPRLEQAAARLMRSLASVSGVTLDLNSDEGDAILSGRGELLAGQGTLTELLSGCEVRLTPYSFAQLHGAAGEELSRQVAALLGASGGDLVLDLYAGVGALALAVAARTGGVVAVERVLDAARAGAGAAARCGHQVSFVAGDSGDVLTGLARAGRPVAATIVDPPRRGLSSSAVAGLLGAQPRQLIYVSCHPPALARDLDLLEHGGYHPVTLLALDLFPQTPGVEVVALLERG